MSASAAILPLKDNCFNFFETQWVTLNDGNFFDIVKTGIDSGEVANKPGTYVLVDFSARQDKTLSWGSGVVSGALFTIDDNGKVQPGQKSEETRMPRLTTWPPK